MKVNTIPGNTPIKNIPSDYFPEGCGFWLELSKGMDKSKKLFYSDFIIGEGDPIATLVFVHGNPENSYTYRKLIKNLREIAKKTIRCITFDHIGFGLSDQATHQMFCMDHSENLLQLIEHLDLKKVTLIVHDWGGPIGIGAFLKKPQLVSNLIVLNSTVFPIPKTGITFQNYPTKYWNWARGPKIIPNSLWGEYSATAIFLKPSKPFNIYWKALLLILSKKLKFYGIKEKTAKKLFIKQFEPIMNTLSSKRLVLQTPVWAHGNIYHDKELGVRDTTQFYKEIQDNIKKKWGPDGQNIGVRALFGSWDPLAKDEVLNQWIENLPQLKENIQKFENVGHFIEEIKPKEIAEAISNLINLT